MSEQKLEGQQQTLIRQSIEDCHEADLVVDEDESGTRCCDALGHHDRRHARRDRRNVGQDHTIQIAGQMTARYEWRRWRIKFQLLYFNAQSLADPI
jgi:hypothetical protein